MEQDGDSVDDEISASWDTQTILGGGGADVRAGDDARVYLLVFEAESSRMVPLAADGSVVIGRGEVDVRLHDDSVSRRHAQLAITAGQAVITDLGSRAGTRVNGERISNGRPLVSGDQITLGTLSLSFHSSARHMPAREVLGLPAFLNRAEQEIERALRFRRPLALMALNLGLGGRGDRIMLPRMITSRLRALDVLSWAAADQLLLLLPEHDGEAATAISEDILEVLASTAPQSRMGIATAPGDGCDVDTLIGSARAAALVADAQKAVAAANARSTRTLGHRTLVMADPVMTRLYALIERLAVADLAVLVCGETGTGKELAANALHAWSPRSAHPLISLNCAAIAETLVESELFGHEKGAFSGATASRAGLLETASGGTVFLDEIGELSLTVQAKLLRVLEAKRITRVGDVREREVDIRVIAATNRNLDEQVKKGQFRSDLFFRLSGATLWLPPLRDRKRELPLLAQMFLEDACKALHRDPAELSPGAIQTLAGYAWPGNVRELKNVMEYLAATVFEDLIEPDHVVDRLRAANTDGPPPDVASPASPAPEEGEDDATQPPSKLFRPLEEELRELERTRIEEALQAARGNQTRAAALISMPLRTFMSKVKLHNLSPKRK